CTPCSPKFSSPFLASPGLSLAKTSSPAASHGTTHRSTLASTTISSAQLILRGPIFAVTMLAIFHHSTRMCQSLLQAYFRVVNNVRCQVL
ncbi:hypothetical protein AX15_006532, partial [Amanita polypyramis BW_CC]